jgi:prepilin-type N-terminal cleavage/methylation domain-containing protein
MTRTKILGFTLIELMIVIAIIGVLAAIAVGNYTSMTRKSGEGMTKGNLGALRSALSIYYGNNDGFYPTDNLICLVNSKTLLATPITRLQPYHGDSALVTPETSVTEMGGWSYNNSISDTYWGLIHVGCMHQDTRGNVWSVY